MQRRYLFSKIFSGIARSGAGKQFTPPKEMIIFGSSEDKTSVASVKWQVFSDTEYGGTSKCEYSLDPRGEILYFKGNMSVGVNSAEQTSMQKATGGYCAITGFLPSSVDLRDYEGVEILLRTNKPLNFIFNLKPDSLAKDDMYQIIIGTTNSSWKRFQIPFSAFSLTSKGQINMQQRVLDNLKLKSFGFLMSVVNGYFELDIKSVRAVHSVDESLVNKTRMSAPLSDNDVSELYPDDNFQKMFSGASAPISKQIRPSAKSSIKPAGKGSE